MVTNLARAWGARIINPIAHAFGALGLSPNALTLFGFIATVAVSVLVAVGPLPLAGLLLIVTLGFDAVDGALARMTGTVSRFGAFLDSTLDRWAEVALYGALIWRFLAANDDLAVLLAVAAMAMSLMVSYTRARAEGIGVQCTEGFLTRFERLVILIAGMVLGPMVWALGLIAVLAGFTAVQRMWVTWRIAHRHK